MVNENPAGGALQAKKPRSADQPTSPVTTDATSTVTADAGRPGADAAPANPAGAAIREAAEKAEIERLTQQRDELKDLIGEAPTVAMLRAEVAALEQAVARAGVSRTTRYTMSAGVAAELEQTGFAVDPTTGAAYVRDGDQVTVTARTGGTRTVDMPQPSDAASTAKK